MQNKLTKEEIELLDDVISYYVTNNLGKKENEIENFVLMYRNILFNENNVKRNNALLEIDALQQKEDIILKHIDNEKGILYRLRRKIIDNG